jgi:hypothetical protein
MSDKIQAAATKHTHVRSSTKDSALQRAAVVRVDPSLQPVSSEGHFEHDFSRVRIQHHVPTVPQAKLTIGQPGDQYEREADRAADTVKRMSASNKEADATLQCKESGAPSQIAHTQSVPPIVHDVLHSSGQPLDISTRAYMEPHFGYDFSGVRVHADDRAAASARAVNALAYTVGRDVVFGAEQYAPGTIAGKRLLAHELTHVVQQYSPDSYMLARQTVTQHEMMPVTIERADIEKLVGMSYWVNRVGEVYNQTYVPPVTDRFKTNPEERDAVLSTLWKVKPTGRVAGETTQIVTIPAEARSQASKPAKTLLYQFIFKPQKSVTAKDKNSVEVSFLAEGGAAEVTTAPLPSPGYKAPYLPGEFDEFPEGSDEYWKKYPDEQKQLFNWIEQSASQSFEQVVTTSANVVQRKKTVTHTSTFSVKGVKDAQGKVTDLTVRFIIDALPMTQKSLPPDYSNKDFEDLELEKAQTISDPKKGDFLGKIKGTIPPDGLLSVKFVVESYFRSGTRNAEVDTIVPVAQTDKEVFYSMSFQAATKPKTIDVDVVRIGEKGTATPGKIDPTRLDITRVKGYAENSADPAKLQAWLKKRYPGESIRGSTVQDITQNMNTLMQRSSSVETTAWFSSNYDIQILDETSGHDHLSEYLKKYPEDAKKVDTDVKIFDKDELRILELSLETLSDAILPTLKGVQMVRQEAEIGPKTSDGLTTDGLTLRDGKTVIIYDNAFASDAHLFIGGTGRVLPSSVETYTHEFGHVVSSTPGVKKAFLDFVTKHHIKPVTWYAEHPPKGESPQEEYFPEAFALYNTDPEWMKTNLPDLFGWFEKLSRTGKAPAP